MKIKQSETRVLKRSEITLAWYNPRKISDDARKRLKRNLKSKGLLGGIVWNEQTGNLVSGHQKLSIIDEIEKYNPGTHENDYEIRVEVVNLSEKEEKEQNIFMNSPSAQGEYDNDLLADLMKDIDYELAGLSQEDINILITDVPFFELAEFNDDVANDFKDLEQKTDEERAIEKEIKKQTVKQAKAQVKEQLEQEIEGETWVTLSFQSYANKVSFMEMIGQNVELKIIKGEPLIDMLNQ
ncbi:hypothetical protein CAPN004_10640 [Capnocytophaga cynodegmi]|uniref:hypothetical protein n=1 Tax=Capnocytophaga cynodegmi TaxID=28189 RepID=UPI001AC7A8A7|nr:hypothetical protein [Capnocytophaga cynodegmi]GIM52034.1 hypothetical protein CAPN004_10640 [Capnocytophaga cynodegmi]